MIVAFCGPIGSGKTTAAKYLVKRYGFERVRFAEAGKNMLRAIGLSSDELDGYLKEQPCDKLGGRTPRYAMQTLLTEWGRNTMYDGIWVDTWSRAATSVVDAVVDDLRYPNEFDAVKDRRGMVIRLEGRSAGVTTTHASESHLDALTPDRTIANDGNTKALYDALDSVVSLWRVNLGEVKPEHAISVPRQPWHDWYLDLAKFVSQRSRHPVLKVGAVIARGDNTQASFGYNDFPRGVKHDPARYDDPMFHTVHAEVNAVLNAREVIHPGHTLYTTLHPCSHCAGCLIQAGVRRVVIGCEPIPHKWRDDMRLARKIMNEASVQLIDYGGQTP